MTAKSLARCVGRPTSWLSNLGAGQETPTRGELEIVANALSIDQPTRERWSSLAGHASVAFLSFTSLLRAHKLFRDEELATGLYMLGCSAEYAVRPTSSYARDTPEAWTRVVPSLRSAVDEGRYVHASGNDVSAFMKRHGFAVGADFDQSRLVDFLDKNGIAVKAR